MSLTSEEQFALAGLVDRVAALEAHAKECATRGHIHGIPDKLKRFTGPVDDGTDWARNYDEGYRAGYQDALSKAGEVFMDMLKERVTGADR